MFRHQRICTKKYVVTLTQENNHGICLVYVVCNEKRNTLLCAKHGVNDPLYREITIPDVFSCSLIIAHETYNPDELSRVKEG